MDEVRHVSRGASRSRSCLVCADCQLVGNTLANWQPVELLTYYSYIDVYYHMQLIHVASHICLLINTSIQI